VRDSKLRDRLLRDLYIGLAVAFVALRRHVRRRADEQLSEGRWVL
jgi:hypothetical protein